MADENKQINDDFKPEIGKDQWVEQYEKRRQRRGGLPGLVDRASEIIPPRAWFLILIGVGALLPLVTTSDQVMRIATDVMLMGLLALGLNIVVGYSGMLDLGFVAFYGVGAYTYAYLSANLGFMGVDGLFFPSLLTILIVMIIGALVGALLGSASLRLSGDYLAIVTLGFGLAFVNALEGLTRVRLPFAEDTINLTNGPNGITGLADISLLGFTIETRVGYYLLLLVMFALSLLVVYNMNRSPLGRAWRSMREDELATQAMGMDVQSLKLQAFVIAAAIASFAGALFAAQQGSVFPSNFDTSRLITVYAIVVLGGLGSLPGVFAGALIMIVVPEMLRNPNLAGLLFYGTTLVVLFTAFKPRWKGAVLLLATAIFGLLVKLIGGGLLVTDVLDPINIEMFLLQPLEPVLNAIRSWVLVPEDVRLAGNWAFVGMLLGVLAASRIKNVWLQLVVLTPTLYLLAMAWELRLSEEASITRLIFIGLMLVVLMIYRPNGLLGTRRVEVV